MKTTIPSLNALISPHQHFPKAIQQALLLAESHPCLTAAMTRGYLRVLKALVTIVDKRDGCAPFTVLPKLLAPKAGVSGKTVQRALGTFRDSGLIEQVGDGRDDTGAFTPRTYHFTDSLARLLGLPIGERSPSQRTKMSGDVYINLSLLRDQPEISDESSGTSKAEATPITLPAELASLPEELGIKDTGIAKLRGMAHSAGHNLADIVACARARMKQLGAVNGRAFKYLARMIEKPSDYAGRAAQAGRVAAESEQAARAKELARSCLGKRFVASTGLTYRFLSGGIAEILNGGQIIGTVAGPQMRDLYAMVAAGELTELTASATATVPVASAAPAAQGKRAVSQLGALLATMKKNSTSSTPAAGTSPRLAQMKWLENTETPTP